MSYQPVTGRGSVIARARRARNGLGQLQPQLPPAPPAVGTTTSDPLWARIFAPLAAPFAQATASRIAYGQTPNYFPSGFGFQSPTGFYGGGAYGGFNPSSLLLLGGAGLVVMMLMRR